MIPRSRLYQGMGLVVLAVACFAALDTATKLVALAVPALMLVAFRYGFQALVTTAALLWQGSPQQLRTAHPGLQLLRGGLIVACSLITFFGLQHMPVGEFTAIMMLTPLVTAAGAALASRQRLSPLRWCLLLGSLGGALVIVRPGHALFQLASLLPLALVLTLAAFQLVTSRLARLEPAGTTHFYTGCCGALVGGISLPWTWHTPADAATWLTLLLISLFSSLGHYLLILAYDRAPAIELTPLFYFQIAFAMLGGWLVFAHVPDAWAWLGMGMIALCGVLSALLGAREQAARLAAERTAEAWAEVAP